MGEFTAKGVLSGEDYGDVYKNVSAVKQNQMQQMLQAQQLAGQTQNAAYNYASELAKQNQIEQAQRVATNAEQLANAQREASLQYLAPGTTAVNAAGQRYVTSTAGGAEKSAPNQILARQANEQAALIESGYNVDADARYNPNNPQYANYQNIEMYRQARNLTTPQGLAAENAKRQLAGQAPLTEEQAKQAAAFSLKNFIGNTQDVNALNDYDAFGKRIDRQAYFNDIERQKAAGQTLDYQRLGANGVVFNETPSAAFYQTLSPQEQQQYQNAAAQQQANAWYQNLWNSMRGNNPQVISQTPTRKP